MTTRLQPALCYTGYVTSGYVTEAEFGLGAYELKHCVTRVVFLH